MNRFHVHIHVVDLAANIRFYSQLFGAQPSVVKADYAKWMLDDPGLNFAISNPHDGKVPGLAHLGLQADSREALELIGNRLKTADAVALAESGTTCCYAQSDKYWAEDPQGLHWESFHSHGEATTYFAPAALADGNTANCCEPRVAAAVTQGMATTTAGPMSPQLPEEKSVSACC